MPKMEHHQMELVEQTKQTKQPVHQFLIIYLIHTNTFTHVNNFFSLHFSQVFAFDSNNSN